MQKTTKRNPSPIPGYRLLEPLGRGGFGEVWKCEAPGGLFKAIKFIKGDRNLIHDDLTPAFEEMQAIQHIKSLRHPFLLSMERVEWLNGELVIVMELADKSLMDVFGEYHDKGAVGVPRSELLRYLHEAADVLDFMNLHHGLQHLDVKPANLFLVSKHVKVADFGLVRSLSDARAAAGEKKQESHLSSTVVRMGGGLTAWYASPELFRNTISSSCDQYSLAIVFQELLTGTQPFSGTNARQLMIQHCTAAPDVSALPKTDRAVVARALAKEPGQRFPTCTDFVRALEAKDKTKHDTASLKETIRCTSEWMGEWADIHVAGSEVIVPSERRAGVCALVAELIVEAKGESSEPAAPGSPAVHPSNGVLQGRFSTRLSAADAFAAFETFRRQWNAQLVRETENSIAYRITFPSHFWQRWLEGVRGLLVEVRWTKPRHDSAALPEFTVRIRCSDKKSREEQKLVCDIGPLVLDSLRWYLEAHPERRTKERVEWPHPVCAAFMLADNKFSEPLEGKGKDLSLGGMGLYLPRALAGAQVRLELHRPSNSEPVFLDGNCVRVQLQSDGWFETGILF